MLTPALYVIPGWVQRAVTRNKINNIGDSLYRDLRAICSTHDIASCYYLNNNYCVRGAKLSTNELTSAFKATTEEELAEITASVIPLSCTSELAMSTQERLLAINNMTDSEYSFIINQNVILLVLSEGFATKILSAPYLLDFIRSYLKVMYTLYSIADVARSEIYALYIELLNETMLND